MPVPSFPELPIQELEQAEATISAKCYIGEAAAAEMQKAWATFAERVEQTFRVLANTLSVLKIPDDEIVGVVKLISEMPAKPTCTTICDTDDSVTVVLKERANATLSQAWTDWTNAIQPLYDHLTDLIERFSPVGGVYGAASALNLDSLVLSTEVRGIDLGQVLRDCIDRVFEAEQAFDSRRQAQIFCQILEQAVDEANAMSDAEAEALFDKMSGLDFNSEADPSTTNAGPSASSNEFDM